MFKKSLSFVLIIMFLMSVISPCIVPAATYELGDVNNDGTIDTYDCLMIKQHICGNYQLSENEVSYADMDNNGSIDAFDYVYLRRVVLGNLNQGIVITRREAVSFGKSYTTSVPASETYPDNYELTDGAIASSASYTNGAFSGYTSNVEIVINLGTDNKNLTGAELSYLSTDEAGILPPKAVVVYGSDSSNGSWQELANVAVPSYTSLDVKSVKIEFAEKVNYTYIRFVVKKATYWVFIDECTVYADVEVSGNDSNSVPTPGTSYVNDTLTEANRVNSLTSVSSGYTYNKQLGMKLVNSNNSITASNPAGIDNRCNNYSNVLINGATTGSAYDSGGWYGVNASKSSDFTVNLGANYTNLCAFKIYFFNRENSKITLPAYVDFQVSSNGYSYTNVGRMYSCATDNENYVFSITFNALIKARYVRFSLPVGKDYYWIEEVEVYQNAANANSVLYGTFDMTFSNNERYWKNEPDMDITQNLISGMTAEIKTPTGLSLSNYAESNSVESESAILTDGKTTDGTDCYLYPWFGFCGGSERNLFYDFGAISLVSEFSVRALNKNSWDIFLPSSVQLIISENGHDWYVAGQVCPFANDESISYSSLKLDKTYKARYASVRFNFEGHYVFIDEITINGKKSISGASSLAESGLSKHEYPDDTVYTVPNSELLGGVEDVVLMYHNIGVMDEDFMLPYVAYIDENGNIADTMFDGFLFLTSPGSGYLPSGGTPYGTNTAADWNFLFSELFAGQKNFDALESATGKVKKLLNKPDYKATVFITIPHMDSSMNGAAFGDLNGDGVGENLSDLNTRIQVAKYYVEKCNNAFKAKGYKNIQIGGYYWFHETITPGSDDATTAIQLNKALDEMGIQLFWIPYYKATGYNYWKDFGFDAAFYQPNYAFSAAVTESRISNTAAEARNLGMSIEMEIDSSALSDIRYFKKYMDYLCGGVTYGYMDNAINMYYQGYDDIASARTSDKPHVRLIYEYTYRFIKDELDIKPDKQTDINVTAKVNTPYFGNVAAGSDAVCEYKLDFTPAHGSVSFDSDGNFAYYPNKGFEGTDTFTYRVSNYLGWSDECTVTITVG